MDTQDQKQDPQNDYNPRYNGRIWGGLFLLFMGGIFLMKEASLFAFPGWFFSWPMILIAVGVFSGIKHGFRGGGWIVLLLVGGFFLMDQMDPDFRIHRYIVPFVIICVGLAMILRPRRRQYDGWNRRDWRHHRRRDWRYYDPGQQYYEARNQEYQASPNQPNDPTGPVPPPPADKTSANNSEDFIDSVSVFGGVRKVIMSKNFRGGEATSFMGGTELDFTQADINGTVILELTQVMGGAKLIVPANWSIKNEVNAVLGGVDDKRQMSISPDPNKVLVLKGTAFLGGLEIRNY